jgi:hypothetical protein
MGNVAKHQQWVKERLDIIRKVTGEALPLPYTFVEHDLMDSGYTSYEKIMPYTYKEIQFYPRYEGKCLCYVDDHPDKFRRLLNERSLFWIVGSKPQ